MYVINESIFQVFQIHSFTHDIKRCSNVVLKLSLEKIKTS